MYIERLFSYPGRTKLRRSLATMLRIDAWLGAPHAAYSTVHIAGTNGKGSVCWKIAAALRSAGFRTGLYLSPHIFSWQERISINSALIPQEFAEEFLPPLFAFVDREGLEPTFFELMTALAFAYFKEQRVDWAVLETGLGGRYDATNVVAPRLSVITSIARDHEELLGYTLEEIAEEKAAIIKPNTPVVLGQRACYAPMLKRADKLLLAPATPGFYDRENSAIARSALETLGIGEEAIGQGLLERPPCRFEKIDPAPILLDVAHNPDGFARLNEALEEFYPGQRFKIIFAMSEKRDPVACIEKIRGRAHRILCVSDGHPRLQPAELLAAQVGAEASTLEEALREREPTVVCGSFYIMNAVRNHIYFNSIR